MYSSFCSETFSYTNANLIPHRQNRLTPKEYDFKHGYTEL